MLAAVTRFHPGATFIGLFSVAVLLAWDKIKLLKYSIVPGPFIVVLLGVGISELLQSLLRIGSGHGSIGTTILVQVPVSETLAGVADFLRFPDFSQIAEPSDSDRRLHDRHRGVARDAAQPRSSRQTRSATTLFAAEPRAFRPRRRQPRRWA